jgi:molecular chaperone DnaK (HSP70)
VDYADGSRVFTPTQVLAAFFTKMKALIRGANPAVVTPSVVVSVPAYFTDAQRQAVRDAAAIAGLNCLRTLNDGTAAALSYGMWKSAKKEFAEGKETRVLFLDCGHGHFTATIAGFTNTSMRVLASVSDDGVGGREFDLAIAKHFAAEFQAKTGLDAWASRKARASDVTVRSAMP